MLATATIPKPANTSPGLSIASGASLPSSPGALSNSLSPPSPASTTGLTIHANATAETLSVDNELTNLGWLQKPGVLTSMCTALTGSPHKHSKTGTRSIRKPRSTKALDGAKADHIRRSSDKMVNVILNVRNRKYNGEDAHKPPLSFACMIFMSIESSPTKTLPVKDIYEWIMWKFPYYRNAAPGWKNSVRHNLSLNKCFKKVQRCSTRSRNTISKGGLWTVDPDYRRCLLAALKRSPYHPYHRYFTPPLSPSSSSSSLESLNPAERDAALTMCMMTSGGTTPNVTPDILHAIIHDHCYSKRPAISLPNGFGRHTGLTLDEVAAAAELILAQDAAKDNNDSSDEGIGEMDSDCDDEDDDGMEEEEEEEDEEDIPNLGDSGYGGGTSMEEMGADALLCLAGGRSRSISPDKGNTATNS